MLLMTILERLSEKSSHLSLAIGDRPLSSGALQGCLLSPLFIASSSLIVALVVALRDPLLRRPEVAKQEAHDRVLLRGARV